MAQRQGREGRAAASLALAQHGGNWRQKARGILQGEARSVRAKRLDPARLWFEAQEPANIEEDTEQRDRKDDAVEPRIVLECGPDDLIQDADDGRDENQKHERAENEALRYHHRIRRRSNEHMSQSLARATRDAIGK